MSALEDFSVNYPVASIFAVMALVLAATLGPIVYYETAYEGPRRRAWEASCASQGGTPVPTAVNSIKGIRHYGAYVCAKLEILK